MRANSDEKQEEFKTGLEAFLEEARNGAVSRRSHRRVRRYFETNGARYIMLDLEQGQTLEPMMRSIV
jgi:hypothetical protein